MASRRQSVLFGSLGSAIHQGRIKVQGMWHWVGGVFEAGSCSWEPDEGKACVTLSLFDLPPPYSLINGQEEAENCHPLHTAPASPFPTTPSNTCLEMQRQSHELPPGSALHPTWDKEVTGKGSCSDTSK